MSTQRPNRNSENIRTYSTSALEGQTDNTFKDSNGTPHSTNEKLTIANNGKITFRERIHHFTWAWFTLTMSTGGIALLLANTPHKFNGLIILGDIVFILDLCLFILLCSGISARFILYPKAFSASLQDATESLFFPTFWISLLSIIANTQLYGVPRCGQWLITTLRVIFWIYTALAFFCAVGQYCYLFAAKQQTLQSMTPAWILPIFPVMLCGTLASVTTGSQTPEHALPMLVAGISFQGLGILVAVFMYGPYIGRLMTNGLPEPNTRPGMFIAVGPPSFTGLALLGMSENFSKIYPAYTTISSITNPDIIADIFRIIAVSAAVFLWATAFWFFCISVVSVLAGAKDMSFHLVWYAFVFPNVGFTIVIINIGKAFKSEGVLWVGSGLTIILVIVWLLVFAAHIRAVVLKQVLWPGKDEDKGERNE
ncbi:hypothetical protein BCIN_16g00030 [Botrytis cinerea B05.10]|uniref:Malic acid transport protein n=3 Tax=Botryotinia fuckeliana TaxID=40559 RepID=A0A384K5T7_BOTFB|nr:hypothetical protein BCIN_16g00030 [Botrytis cinerea B05.10]ATZ58132.1 hypothetical protein BCIN_16g00030 [Botrytis cinerea B05.10]EMR83529.1 putative c4-dicarboxylate transporter malic acid transport protein [Botrytis cinerea BcDW1]